MSEQTIADYRYLSRAFQLASKGRFTVSPNPMVGAVVVAKGEVVGEGWHQRAGYAHAEVNAIADAGDKASNATIYVTLEPCNHFGQTPPCVDAILNAGIHRVVIATADNNPTAAGGAKRLREQGVVVDFLPGWAEINHGFVFRTQYDRPFVSMKMAASTDARTAMASGESQWITGPEARYQGQKLRAQSCAVITGIGSILIDNSRLNVRPDSWLEPYPSSYVRQPLKVVVDSTLQIPSDAAIASEGTLVFYAAANAADIERLAGQGLILIECSSSTGQVDLTKMLAILAKDYLCNHVLIEAGATLSAAFFSQALVNQLHVFSASMLLGQAARPLISLNLDKMSQKISLDLLKSRYVGKDLWHVYDVSGA